MTWSLLVSILFPLSVVGLSKVRMAFDNGVTALDEAGIHIAVKPALYRPFMQQMIENLRIGPYAMRYSLFVLRLYNLCRLLGFERERMMPSRAFCSDESQGYPVILIAQHFGTFPFDHGRSAARSRPTATVPTPITARTSSSSRQAMSAAMPTPGALASISAIAPRGAPSATIAASSVR
jgi:hypothetical protein